MFADTLIQRLKDAGLVVHDIRSQLPRNGRWMARPISAIKGIANHWDASFRPHEYDSLQRYTSEANYHINKDWNASEPGVQGGDGLMYHLKVDNVGDIFICRDFEDVTWHVGDANYSYLAICYDGTTGQQPTREQILTMGKLAEVLCFHCPEFPAGQANFLGHQEVPGNSTACPGSFLTAVKSYRESRNTHPENYSWDYPPQETPPATPPTTEPDYPKLLEEANKQINDLKSNITKLGNQVTEITGQLQGANDAIKSWEKFRDDCWGLLLPTDKEKNTANILSEISTLIAKEDQLNDKLRDEEVEDAKHDQFLANLRLRFDIQGADEDAILTALSSLIQGYKVSVTAYKKQYEDTQLLVEAKDKIIEDLKNKRSEDEKVGNAVTRFINWVFRRGGDQSATINK